MTSWDLNNKNILVTGGTKGIGKATVVSCLSLGAKVLFTARNEVEVNALEQELKATYTHVKGIAADVSDPTDREKIKHWITDQWEVLHALVNNAGINIRKATLAYTEEEYQKVLAINLLAPFELSTLLYPCLEKAEQASIINVASVAGSLDVRTGSPYGMSKAGLIQQSRNLAVEWASAGIRVNTVSPWFTTTPLTQNLLANDEKKSNIIARTPLQRVAEAEEVAAVITFLAMDKASYVTGQNWIVDGGLTANAL